MKSFIQNILGGLSIFCRNPRYPNNKNMQNKPHFGQNHDIASQLNKKAYTKNCHFGNWLCFYKQSQFSLRLIPTGLISIIVVLTRQSHFRRVDLKGSLIGILFLLAAACGWAYDFSSNPGDGTADNPYQLSEPNHLIAMDTDPNAAGGKHFVLAGDIIFDPNIHIFDDALIQSFDGILDGQGYNIENLTIITDQPTISDVGLFGTLEAGSVVQNTGVKNTLISTLVTIETEVTRIGTICGLNEGTIDQCNVFGIVRGGQFVGGLVGSNFGTITDCYTAGLVEGYSTVGGISGGNGNYALTRSGQISLCHASAQIISKGSFEGALVGQFYFGQMTDCAWDKDISQVARAFTAGATWDEEGIERIHRYSTAQMKQKDNFDFLDFAHDPNDPNSLETWRMCVDDVTPPRLNWEFTTRGDFYCPDGVGLEDFDSMSDCFLAMLTIGAELADDNDLTVNLNELANLSAYWEQTGCGCNGADITGNGVVDVNDLTELADVWLMRQRPDCAIADLNRDTEIDLVDMMIFLDAWLEKRLPITE
jgi:hypothetical protein